MPAYHHHHHHEVGLTYTHSNAGESGGGVGGAAEERLDVVSLDVVLAPAEVRAGPGDSLVQTAGQVVSPVSHAAHDLGKVRLALGGARPCRQQSYLRSAEHTDGSPVVPSRIFLMLQKPRQDLDTFLAKQQSE